MNLRNVLISQKMIEQQEINIGQTLKIQMNDFIIHKLFSIQIQKKILIPKEILIIMKKIF